MNWAADLAYGQKREADFHKLFPFLARQDGLKEDFRLPDGSKLELKSERRSSIETPNIAVEVYSSAKSSGALYNAKNNGVKYVAYFFADNFIVIYDFIKLFNYIQYNYSDLRIVGVSGSTARVALIPRWKLKFCETSIKMNKLLTSISPSIETNELLKYTNEDYHAIRTHLSSSNLKTILKDLPKFKAEWFDNLKTEESKSVFDEGSFVHSLILEPDKIEQYAIYPGLRKAGKAYEEFKAENPNKIILSAAQSHRCENLAKTALKHKLVQKLLQNGFPEHTMLSEVLGVPVKKRSDYIVPGNYIVDVKTTSMPSDTDIFRQTVSQYMYELSAALYCEIAFNNTGKQHDFYWLVLSKADGGCVIYKASSATLAYGKGLVTTALLKYKNALATGNWVDNTDASSLELSEEIVEI